MKNGSKILMYTVINLVLVNSSLFLASAPSAEPVKLTQPTKQTPAFWDNVIMSFCKNYRKSNPDHFLPQMSDSVCNVFALQNVIPSVMNLDPNLLEVVIQHVMKLYGGAQPVNLDGWSSAEIVQAMTDALNRLVKKTNKENGY